MVPLAPARLSYREGLAHALAEFVGQQTGRDV